MCFVKWSIEYEGYDKSNEFGKRATYASLQNLHIYFRLNF